MKIIVDDKIPFIHGQVERLADEVVYLPGSAIGPSDVRDADALVVRTRTHCDRRLLEGSRVRFVVTATIGYDHLDTDYLREAGIQWTNCPGCNATSVAQYVRNSLFAIERQGIVDLQQATLGIVGYGHVGTAVYEAMRPYVREIWVNDPYKRPHPLPPPEGREYILSPYTWFIPQDVTTPLPREGGGGGVASCDIITLHTPLTTDGRYPTRHLVDERFLRETTKRPVIINAARGGVVDEEALERALDDGRIRAAIIDTWEGEPHVRRSLLQKAFIGTPHIAGYSADGKANATRMSLEALARWMKEETQEFHILPPEAEAGRTGLRYDPMDDSRRLKNDPDGFEYQRGHYPLRRE